MKTKAVRMHGAMDLRIDEFELPEIKDDEMLVRIVSDSICMSTYKMAKLGAEHKRVPENIAEHPVITGHEFAGDIVEVGAKYKDLYQPGQKFTIQPALNYKGSMDSPGYSYEFCGGDATYCILPMEVFDADCFLPYNGEAYYQASLIEPVSCSVGAFHATYHTSMTDYIHRMGIREGGNLAIMAGAGPMGLGALTYAIHRDVRPARVVVTDINQARLDRAAELFPPEQMLAETGVEVVFVNTATIDDPVAYLRGLTGGDIKNITLKVCTQLVAQNLPGISNKLVSDEIEKYKKSLQDMGENLSSDEGETIVLTGITGILQRTAFT